jgi:hypothetical protein
MIYSIAIATLSVPARYFAIMLTPMANGMSCLSIDQAETDGQSCPNCSSTTPCRYTLLDHTQNELPAWPLSMLSVVHRTSGPRMCGMILLTFTLVSAWSSLATSSSLRSLRAIASTFVGRIDDLMPEVPRQFTRGDMVSHRSRSIWAGGTPVSEYEPDAQTRYRKELMQSRD